MIRRVETFCRELLSKRLTLLAIAAVLAVPVIILGMSTVAAAGGHHWMTDGPEEDGPEDVPQAGSEDVPEAGSEDASGGLPSGGSGGVPAGAVSGDAETIRAFITGFSFFDNTPNGSAEISHPILHQSAGGTGTFADPITVAVGHSLNGDEDVLDWPAGTRFYVPNLRRYFIVEDSCGDGSTPQDGPCHVGFPSDAATWLDVWVDGEGGSEEGANACMDAITGVSDALVNPPPDLPVVAESIFGEGGCTQQFGDSAGAGGVATPRTAPIG